MVDWCSPGSLAPHNLAVPRGIDPWYSRRLRRADSVSAFRFGVRVTGVQPLTTDANGETFYAGALDRISRIMIVLAVVLGAAAWWRYGWRVALGFACGCAVAYLNFHWL